MGPSHLSAILLLAVLAIPAASQEAGDVKPEVRKEAGDEAARDVDAAPPPSEAAPGQIIIKPTGRKRVSRVGVAPPPPEVDYRVLARGDQPKGGGPYVYYPVHYIPTYSYCGGYYGSYYGGYYGDCHRYSSYDYGRPYCP